MPRKRTTRRSRRAKKEPYRSGLERWFGEECERLGVEFAYELHTFEIPDTVRNASCDECGSKRITKTFKYTPDWFFPSGMIVETKGRMTARDRKALLYLRKAGVDIRVVFGADNKLSKASKTRYTDWCAKNDIPCAVRRIPAKWIKEMK